MFIYNVPHSAVNEAMPPRIKGCAVPIAAIENSSVDSLRILALNAATSTILLNDTSNYMLFTRVFHDFPMLSFSNLSRGLTSYGLSKKIKNLVCASQIITSLYYRATSISFRLQDSKIKLYLC